MAGEAVAHRGPGAAAKPGPDFLAGALGYALNPFFLLLEKRFVHGAGR